jgi:hypothetical protein
MAEEKKRFPWWLLTLAAVLLDGGRMDEHRKRAYRHLLYHAMLDIRPLAWRRLGWHPLWWKECFRLARRAGAIADWLHKLASFSRNDFEGFDEDWLWRDFDELNRRHPDYQLSCYKDVFERQLLEVQSF